MIIVTNCSFSLGGDGKTILRGVIAPESLNDIKTPSYQREVLPSVTLQNAFKNKSTIPDVELGMRGHLYEKNGETGIMVTLLDDVYIIDGLQRISSAIKYLQSEEGKSFPPKLGASIHFGTTEEWEKNHFLILNTQRIKLSSNIHLRNAHTELPVMDMLYKLCQDEEKDFVLRGKVCWNQKKKKSELITAIIFIRIIGYLHAHLGVPKTDNTLVLIQELQKIADQHDMLNLMRENVRHFFAVLNKAFDIDNIAYTRESTVLTATFMTTLAKFFSDHPDFWRSNVRLVVDPSIEKRLSKFPVRDETIKHLSAAGRGRPNKIIEEKIQEHLNRNKKEENRLKPR